MTIVARYIWGDKQNGSSGWIPWDPPLPRIERDRATGYWAILDGDGSRLCLCVDRKGAGRVVRRLRRAQVERYTTRDHATLSRTNAGWVLRTSILESENDRIFTTREEAEASLHSEL